MRLRLFASGALVVPASMLLLASTSACSGDDTNAPGAPTVDASADGDASLPRPDGSANDAAPDATADTSSPDANGDAPTGPDSSFDSGPFDAGLPEMDATSPGPAGGHYALHFGGTQYLRVPYEGALAQVKITLEAWVRVEATPTYFCAVCLPFGDQTSDSYSLWARSLLAGTSVQPGGDLTTDFEPSLGEWHHLAMTGDPTNGVALYVDGAFLASGTTWTGVPADYDGHDLLIGADMDNGVLDGFMLGDIDDVRIWNTVRNQGQIEADMLVDKVGPSPDLVGEWTFDEGTGTTAFDSSGLHLDAILGDGQNGVTMPIWVAIPATGDD